jgi:hypothetical protein
MDARRFDALVKTLGATDTRRTMLRLLGQLPLAAGLAVLLDPDGAAANGSGAIGGGGRRRRRKARHDPGGDKDHRKGKRKKSDRKKGHGRPRRCVPESPAETCAGTCATVTNNCGTPVECGSCACEPPCGACFTCQVGPNTPGACTPVPNNTVACDGSPLRSVGAGIVCTTGTQSGICVNGACFCAGSLYDPASNVCRCRFGSFCATNPPPVQCCAVTEVCSNSFSREICVACP